MSWPALVRPEHCRIPIRLVIEREELDEDGAPVPALEWDGLCNWQDGGRTVLTETQKVVQVLGRALFPGDICPELGHITGGWGIVFGQRRAILRGTKARNPDGTVNYTEVWFQ